MPQMINYLKVRASWASVGSAIEPNLSSAWRYEYNPALGTYKTVTYKFPKKFYPERTDSWEAGVTARLFGNALSVDLTVYQSNTRKQTLLRDVTSGAAGFNKEYIQTGNIRNRGLELSVGYTKSWADFTWSSSLAYSMNRNKIVELLENPNEVVRQAGLSGCGVVLKKGGGMGDIYTYTDFKRDAEGNIALDSNGNVMQTNLSNPQYRGSVLPKGNLGFSNDFSWKGVNLGFVLTARLGGICMSQTQAILDEYGVSAVSAEARNNGGIAVNTGKISAEGYYAVVGGDNPIWSEYIYSATNVRLQEAHISYTLPRKWLKSKELTLGVTANNRPGNNMEEPPFVATNDSPTRLTPELANLIPTNPNQPYNIKEMIEAVADDKSFFELQAEYAANIVTGYIRLNGKTVGVVANQPLVLAGTLDINASVKAARFVRFCDAFNIPLLTLVG